MYANGAKSAEKQKRDTKATKTRHQEHEKLFVPFVLALCSLRYPVSCQIGELGD
jgi:hypothetical protein